MDQNAALLGVKECPFCESRDVAFKRGRTKYQLRCLTCGGCGPIVKQLEYLWNERAAVADALDAWNSRPIEEGSETAERESEAAIAGTKIPSAS